MVFESQEDAATESRGKGCQSHQARTRFPIYSVGMRAPGPPFTFDKIRRYRGEAAEEIGLREGVEVRFSEKDGLVEAVEIG